MSSGIEGKKVLFLVKDTNNIKATSTFLDRRELQTYVCEDLKEAIRIMQNTPPDFLCISVNYPHPKVSHIPKLISSTFGVESIILAEKGTKHAINLLSQAQSRHVLFGAVSGPSLLMKIRKIVKDQEEEERIRDVVDNQSADRGAQVIKSSQPRKKESYHVHSGSAQEQNQSGGKKRKNQTMIFSKTDEEKEKEKGRGYYNPQESSENQEKKEGNEKPKPKGSLNSPFLSPSAKKDLNLDPFGNSKNAEEGSKETSKKEDSIKAGKKEDNSNKASKKSDVKANSKPVTSNKDIEELKPTKLDEIEEDVPTPFSGLVEASGGLFAMPPVESELPSKDASNEEMDGEKQASPPKTSKQKDPHEQGTKPNIGYMPEHNKTNESKDSGYVDLDSEIEKSKSPESKNKGKYKEHNQKTNEASNTPSFSKGTEKSIPKEKKGNVDEEKAPRTGKGVYIGKKGEPSNPFADDNSLKPREDYLEEPDFKSFKSSISLAVDQICNVNKTPESSIDTLEKVGFIPIDSGRYCGYLTVALAESKKLRGVLLQELGINIAENLFEMGENIEPDEAVILDISDPDLIDWAKKKSQVLINSQHNGAEIIISYIPKNQALPIIIEASTDMFTIDVIDIEPGKLLDFETYLHLPKNNKYIKYSRTGSSFSEKQISKLHKQAKGRVAIKQDDNYNFKRNYIEKSVNEELEQFKKSTPAKKKKAS